MKQVVFPQKKVATFLSSHFVPVVLDIEDDALPEGFGYIGVPTFYIISEKGKKLGMMLGGASADRFIKKLKEKLGK
jgi:thioredoxin-related protein